MFGAIIGDIVGSRFEFNNIKSKEFGFFLEECSFTDDTVYTTAVADIFLYNLDSAPAMQKFCRDYPDAGYGGWFFQWIWHKEPKPYGSFGNGAAMRVSPPAFLNRHNNLDDAFPLAETRTHSAPLWRRLPKRCTALKSIISKPPATNIWTSGL